jgi:hypothetical protein
MGIRIKGTRFVYYPIPKCACTSLKTAIFEHNGPPKEGRYDENIGVHGWHGYGTYRWERRRLLLRPWLRAFCIIRDPIDRFVSGYRNRIVHHGDLGEVPTINEFALALEEHASANSAVHHHFAPMTEFVGRDPSIFHRIFTLNQLDQIPNYLGVRLNIPRTQEGGPKLTRSHLSDEALGHLQRYYADDYQIWGASLNSPKAERAEES